MELADRLIASSFPQLRRRDLSPMDKEIVTQCNLLGILPLNLTLWLGN